MAKKLNREGIVGIYFYRYAAFVVQFGIFAGNAHRRWQRRIAGALLALVLVAGCGMPGTIPTGGHLPPVPTTSIAVRLPLVRFPQDEGPHHDLTEWWYYTGHLTTPDGHHYGFEEVFFQALRDDLPPVYAAHFAITDVTRGQFHFAQRQQVEPDVFVRNRSGSGFDLAVGDWRMEGGGGHDRLVASMPDYAIQLALTATKPPVLHGDDGLISYGSAGFSYYYSRTRMMVAGWIIDHGRSLPVTGVAWMDHQWGNFISLLGGGWDWLSIQLDNNTEYMIYFIRSASHQILSTYATRVGPDGRAQVLAAGSFQVRATGIWISPHTGAVYPSGWVVAIPGEALTLTLTPEVRDQELLTAASTGVSYWEGATWVSGELAGVSVRGEAYVELTGYAR
jgi:predicted secreted hydrolase